MRTIFHPIILLSLTLISLAASSAAQTRPANAETVNVLFAADSRSDAVSQIAEAVRQTIREVSGDQTSWSFSEIAYLDELSTDAFDEQLSAQNLDLVIGFGPAATAMLQQSLPADRSAITVGIVHPTIQEVPYRESSDSSGRDNFTYIWPQHDLGAEIALMRSIRPVDDLIIVYSELMGLSEDQRTRVSAYLGQEFALNITFVTEKDVIDGSFPSDPDFAYILDLPDLRPAMYRETVSALTAAKIPAFAYDRNGVAEGALASLYRPEDRTQLIRRIALRALTVSRGESLASESVSIDAEEQPTFNLAAAEATGTPIPYTVLLEGRVLESSTINPEDSLSLDVMIDQVLEQNLSFAAQQSDAQVRFEAIKQARARLLPSLTFQLDGILIDTDRARASLGQQPQFLLRPSLTLEQIIWSEPAYAGLDSQKAAALAAQAELEAFRLDLINQAVAAYIGLAKLDAQVGLLQDSNARIEARLRNAERRYEVGDTGQADVFRLRSELAGGRTNLIDAIIQRQQTQIQLNTLLNRPAGQDLSVSSDFSEMPGEYGFSSELSVDAVSPSSLRELREDLTAVAWSFAPEVRQIGHARDAQERQVRSAQRSYWNPTVAARGEVAYTGARFGVGSDRSPDFELPGTGGGGGPALPDLSGAFPIPNDWDWTLGVNLSLPLIRGGGRLANERVAELELSVIDTRLADIRNRLELRVHAAVNTLVGKKLALGLAQERVDSARQTFALVSSAYAEGAATVVDVVDAETLLRAAEISKTVAYYDIVSADFDLQRAIGVFARDMTDEQRASVLEVVPENTRRSAESPAVQD